MELLESDPALRIVWKELPALGPVSRFAARASMAAQEQGRFLEFHVAVMGAPGKLSEDRLMAIAEGIELDVERLRRDIADPALEAYLDETYRLATEIGITGTPAFVLSSSRRRDCNRDVAHGAAASPRPPTPPACRHRYRAPCRRSLPDALNRCCFTRRPTRIGRADS